MNKNKILKIISAVSVCAGIGLAISTVALAIKVQQVQTELEEEKKKEQYIEISFDSNGGRGAMSSVFVEKGSYSLPECGFTAPTNGEFKCWLVGGEEKLPADVVNIVQKTIIKALWSSPTTLTILNAHENWGSVTGAGDYAIGDIANVEANAAEHYLFKGWYLGDNLVSKEPAYSFKVEGLTVLTAKFDSDLIYKDDGKTITGPYDTNIESVEIPDSVTKIDKSAFLECFSLKSACMPDSLTDIGHGAFYECTALEVADIPAHVINIGDSAFRKCTSLKAVHIPASVTYIGTHAFNGCSSLEDIKVDASNTVYDSRLNCRAIVETATNTLLYGGNNSLVPESITEIGQLAFSNCNGIKTLTLPTTLKKIDYWAFEDCHSLIAINLPYGLETIEYGAFRQCTSLASIVFPSTLISIPNDCFVRCSRLKNVVLPSTFTSIGDGAFSQCSSLDRLVIPSLVSFVGEDALFGCSSCTIYCKADSQPSSWSQNWNSSNRPVVWSYDGE